MTKDICEWCGEKREDDSLTSGSDKICANCFEELKERQI